MQLAGTTKNEEAEMSERIHWKIKHAKAECFTGPDDRHGLVKDINAWLDKNPDIMILAISFGDVDDEAYATVFYE